MSDRVRQYLSVLSLVLFLGGSSLADIGHSHFLSSGFNSTSSLQSHDCNDKEHHKPLDVRFHCVQSCRVLSFSNLLVIETFRPAITIEYVSWGDVHDECDSPFLLAESKRGPPIAS